MIWKPSEKTPLTAIACQALFAKTLKACPEVPPAISCLVIGGSDIGQRLSASPALPLISATGSIPMGRAVAQTVAARLGRSLLELGGNNGMLVAPSADLKLAVRAATFSAVGTCGQRCTSLRRLFVHNSIADKLRDSLLEVYKGLPIGDPTAEGTLIGPLIDERAGQAMDDALTAAKSQGGTVHGGGRVTEGVPEGGVYVKPALVEISADAPIVQQETFAPILYLLRYDSLDEAIEVHNAVPQGLSSAILTQDVREAERFCSPADRTAASSMSTLVPAVLKLAVRLGARRRLVAVANRGRTHGKPTCAAQLIQLTTPANCRSPKAFNSTSKPRPAPCNWPGRSLQWHATRRAPLFVSLDG